MVNQVLWAPRYLPIGASWGGNKLLRITTLKTWGETDGGIPYLRLQI